MSSPPETKRGRKSAKKEQKTLEETMDLYAHPQSGALETAKTITRENQEDAEQQTEVRGTEEKPDQVMADTNVEDNSNGHDAKEEENQKTTEEKEESKADDISESEAQPSSNAKDGEDETAVEPNAREEETPSSILEKGIIYFFFRGRVGIDHPSDPNEIARSYFVMRPLPHGAKLTDGPIGDDGNSRLLALPKKILPKSPKDRFMSFVEKAGTSFSDLRENFLSSSDYATKTAGTRHTPAATPVAEGVYAITTTGRESHLAYIITIPNALTEVQTDIGLREKGSFIVSLRNPQYEAPAAAQLPQNPEFPKE